MRSLERNQQTGFKNHPIPKQLKQLQQHHRSSQHRLHPPHCLYLFLTPSIPQSTFTAKGFQKTKNVEHNKPSLSFLLSLHYMLSEKSDYQTNTTQTLVTSNQPTHPPTNKRTGIQQANPLTCQPTIHATHATT